MNKLGKYQIRRTLGKGAMGVVYEGFDPVIERRVAIKTILTSQLGGDQSGNLLARFKREAQAAGRLNHPGIVAIYEYGEDIEQDTSDDEATRLAPPAATAPAQRVAFIAMEFVDGRELRDCFERGERFPLPEVTRIMGEILAALDHAHAQGVVHRDIKPANLILLPDGRVKVADFGIARIGASELTQTGAVLARPRTCRPNSSRTSRWTAAATSFRAASSSTSCSPARSLSPASRPPRSCTRCCARSRCRRPSSISR